MVASSMRLPCRKLEADEERAAQGVLRWEQARLACSRELARLAAERRAARAECERAADAQIALALQAHKCCAAGAQVRSPDMPPWGCMTLALSMPLLHLLLSAVCRTTSHA
jgi:hypothetical protein